jgi:hypothetical protein
MTKKNYQIVETVNRKIEKRGKIDTSNTHLYIYIYNITDSYVYNYIVRLNNVIIKHFTIIS